MQDMDVVKKAATKVCDKLADCKKLQILGKSLAVDFKTGSDFQTLEWAGDRYLKALLAEKALSTYEGLADQGQLSVLCTNCENNEALARIFDRMGFSKLVDQGTEHTEQICDMVKRKADIIEAVIAELYKKRRDHNTAKEALEMLVNLIYLGGQQSSTISDNCRVSSNGYGKDAVPGGEATSAQQQTVPKNAIQVIHEWSQKQKKIVKWIDSDEPLANGMWQAKISIDGVVLDDAVGEGKTKQDARMKVADQTISIKNIRPFE